MFGPGTLTGATDFVLRQPRTFRVLAHEGRVRALCMHRSAFEALADQDREVSPVEPALQQCNVAHVEGTSVAQH